MFEVSLYIEDGDFVVIVRGCFEVIKCGYWLFLYGEC